MNGSDSAERRRADPIDVDYEPARPRSRRREGVGLGTVIACSAAAAVAGATIGAYAPRIAPLQQALDATAPNELAGVRANLADVNARIQAASANGALPSAADVAAMQQSLSTATDRLNRFEQGLQLLAGGPEEFEPLRRRIAAVETLPDDPSQATPAQLYRTTQALAARVRTLEEQTSKAAVFQAASVFGDPAQMAARMQGLSNDVRAIQTRVADVASASDLTALATQVRTLQDGFDKVAKDAESASRAAAAAYAVSAAAEAAKASGGFTAAHATLAALLPNDPNVAALGPLAQRGAPTVEELKSEFTTMQTDIVRAAQIAEAGGGLWGRFQAWLAQFVVVRQVGEADTPSGVVDRIAARLKADDLAGAVLEANRLTGAAGTVIAPWLGKARQRLEIEARLAALRASLAGGS
jgi:hypothetical protein